MKVLLFVQTGDALPKCIGNKFTILPASTVVYGRDDIAIAHGYWMTSRQRQAGMDADRWWLVECENAASGRFIITSSIYCPERLEHLHGRILASGGRP